MAATALARVPTARQAAGGDMLTLWAEATGRRRAVTRYRYRGQQDTDPVDTPARLSTQLTQRPRHVESPVR